MSLSALISQFSLTSPNLGELVLLLAAAVAFSLCLFAALDYLVDHDAT